MEDLINRLLNKAPKAFKKAVFSVPTEKPYYKITLNVQDKCHGGYCSDADEENCETTNLTVVCYVQNIEGIVVGDDWFFNLDCSGSGYCPLASNAEVNSIEYIS